MATNAEYVTALDTAISRGVKSVTIDGITTTWQDTDGMLKARAFYAGQAEGDATTAPLRRIPLQIRSGLGA